MATDIIGKKSAKARSIGLAFCHSMTVSFQRRQPHPSVDWSFYGRFVLASGYHHIHLLIKEYYSTRLLALLVPEAVQFPS